MHTVTHRVLRVLTAPLIDGVNRYKVVKCVGMRFYPDSGALAEGKLSIRLHNHNKYDRNAVAVMADGTKMCGYLTAVDALKDRKIMQQLKYVTRIGVHFLGYNENGSYARLRLSSKGAVK